MKVIIALLLTCTALNGSAQYRNYVGVGITQANDIGYFVGVSSFGTISEARSFGVDIQFIKEDVHTSFNGTFGFKWELFKSGVSAFVGPRFGLITNYKEDHLIEGDDGASIRFGGVFSVGYDIDRFQVSGRFYKELNSDLDDSILIGVGYRINRKE